MKRYPEIEKLLQGNDGIIKVSMVSEAGIDKGSFYNYVQRENLEQIAPGVYAASYAWEDELYLLHLRVRQLVFSHETALYLHDLTDREPLQPVVTVKTGYNPSYLKAEGVCVHTIKADLLALGLTHGQTVFGRSVPVYDMERSLCDVIRNRHQLDAEVYLTALKRYMKRSDKDLHKLNQYAQKMRVSNVLNKYLEVLL